MSHAGPPPIPGPRARAELSIAHAAGFARISGVTMLVLGGVSLAISIRAPLSASFLISLAIVLNGWIELRLSRRLKSGVPGAPAGLAINQLAVGLEIAAYAWWQARVFGPEQIDAVLQRPLIASLLEAFPREVVQELLATLPGMIPVLYAAVGVGAFLGCVATAWYYASRVKSLRLAFPRDMYSRDSKTP